MADGCVNRLRAFEAVLPLIMIRGCVLLSFSTLPTLIDDLTLTAAFISHGRHYSDTRRGRMRTRCGPQVCYSSCP